MPKSQKCQNLRDKGTKKQFTHVKYLRCTLQNWRFARFSSSFLPKVAVLASFECQKKA